MYSKIERNLLLIVCSLVFLLSIAHTATAQPANDDCSNATPISGNIIDQPFDTTYATFDIGPAQGSGHNSPNIWYCYTAECTGQVEVSTVCGWADDIRVYDGCGCSPTRFTITAGYIGRFDAIAGNQYLIEIHGQSETDYGTGLLTITCEGPPANDDCSNATPVGNVTDLPFDTTQATPDGTSPLGRNIWYCYTADCTGRVYVSLQGNYGTMIEVYDGCGCPADWDDIITSAGSGLYFDAVAGNQYLIQVGGDSETDFGTGTMSIICYSYTANDDCSGATPVGNVTDLPFDTTYATFDIGPAQGSGHNSPNIWYCYTAECTGQVEVSISECSFSHYISIYDGCGCTPTRVSFAGGYIGIFDAIAGNQYLIEVNGQSETEYGTGKMSISCEETVQQLVDHLVSVSTDRVSYDRRTQEISVDVTVVNISSTAIGNPVWLVIESIGGTNVTLSGSSGTTGDGKPYIDLSGLLGDGQLDPGESVSVRVYFDNPGRSTFSFTPGVRGVI